jgi:hypothetical protein
MSAEQSADAQLLQEESVSHLLWGINPLEGSRGELEERSRKLISNSWIFNYENYCSGFV